MKSLQKEQNSTNLLLWPLICRNKPAITPKWFNSLDTNSRVITFDMKQILSEGALSHSFFKGRFILMIEIISVKKNNDFQNMTWCVPIIWSPNDQNLTTRFKFIGIKWSSAEGADWLCCWMEDLHSITH